MQMLDNTTYSLPSLPHISNHGCTKTSFGEPLPNGYRSPSSRRHRQADLSIRPRVTTSKSLSRKNPRRARRPGKGIALSSRFVLRHTASALSSSKWHRTMFAAGTGNQPMLRTGRDCLAAHDGRTPSWSCPDFRPKHRRRSRAASTEATLPALGTRCSLQRGGNHPAVAEDLPRLVTRIELAVRSPGSLRALA